MTGGNDITNQQKKEYLNQYRVLDNQINRKLEEVAKWKSRATKITASYSHTPKGSCDDKIQKAIDMIADLQEEINKDVDKLISFKSEIDQCFQTVTNDTLRLILEYRYIDGLTFESIACHMNYSWRWILQLHGDALKALQIVHGTSYSKVVK